jgi:hypothetical protein
MTSTLAVPRTVARPPGPALDRPRLTVLSESAPAWAERWCALAGLQRVDRPGGPDVGRDAEAAGRVSSAVLRPGDVPGLPPRPRVLAAVRDLPHDEPVLRAALGLAELAGGVLVPAHAVPVSFGERSVGLEDAVRRGRDTLDDAVTAVATAVASRVPVEPRLLRMWPHEVAAAAPDADVLVIGSGVPLGPVARSAVWHAPCPVLLLIRGGAGATATARDGSAAAGRRGR